MHAVVNGLTNTKARRSVHRSDGYQLRKNYNAKNCGRRIEESGNCVKVGETRLKLGHMMDKDITNKDMAPRGRLVARSP
ncbi:hypothetical protein RRG08_030937 [Elysia crispata]|uniref:Uncharacterized protein n=1 Tax=Elysia crispata TaxID=231223 RepID=A0AAE1ABF1_9GAST|nr:hypothetical protein RRG08_030937 [Elysia crispata]